MTDKAALLAAVMATEAVELPSGAGTVTVRGLTRREAVAVQKAYADGDVDKAEGVIVSAGLVDPKLTEDEAQQWRDVAVAGDIQEVTEAIQRLSKLDDGGGKGPTSSSRSRRK